MERKGLDCRERRYCCSLRSPALSPRVPRPGRGRKPGGALSRPLFCSIATALLAGGLFSLIMLSGCSHSHEAELRDAGIVGNYAAEPPTFLTGPMGVLLTNASGYGAHVTAQNESLGGPQGVNSGQLFCRGTKLLFAPISSEPKKKQARGGGFAFIWDVSSGSGFVLSGALQAYAPVSSSVHATNVVKQGGGTALQTATVQMSDGTAMTFQILPGTDALGVPGRITGSGSRMPLALSLSNVRAGVPPEDVFIPPDDFTKYANPEAMADEIAARQRNLRRKTPLEFEPMQSPMRSGP